MSIRSIFPPILASLLLTIAVSAATPSIEYKIQIKETDLSGFDVEMLVPRVRGTLRIAMAAHPEYDDRYWRYIENFSATARRGRALPFTKEEDTVWRIENTRGETLVRYRLHLPAQQPGSIRDAWKPFLTPDGGMIGDLHSLMYVVGDTSRRARLTLSMPDGWKAASGLEPTRDPRVFTGTVELMLDSPLLVGSISEHDFRAAGVLHKIVFWSPPDAPAFDADAIVAHVQKLSEEAIRAFGPPPYPRYAFLFQNGGQAALEHLTSVNLGVERNLEDLVEETAHEYVHVWNLMDVRPRERVGVKFRFADPTGVLWWNEGATIMFADMLIRRAGLPREPRTRLKRLESEIVRYLSSPGYYTMSAEQVSRGDSHPILLGDSFASTHLQGEVLSTMLDFKIRDATDGQRNVVDVMRLLAQRFDFRHGITNRDIEKAVADVCSCDIHPFFRDYIYAAKKIDFDQYFGLIGVRPEIGTAPAVGRDGSPIPDLRIGPQSPEGPLKIRISNSESAWARAGLRTGDSLVSINGTPMNTWSDLRRWLLAAKIGDVPRVVVIREGITKQVDVVVNGYIIPDVHLVELSSATPKQMRLRAAWSNAN